MKTALVAAACVLSAAAQSHPRAWGFAHPQTRTLIGMNWPAVAHSPFAPAIAGELEFLDAELLAGAQQLVISSHDYLVMATGQFPDAQIRAAAARRGLRAGEYRNVPVLMAARSEELSAALIGEQILLVGTWKAIESAIDRNVALRGREPLEILARAAGLAAADFWIVCDRFPDELAAAFLPLADGARPIAGYEAAVTLRGGVALDAVFTTRNEADARRLAQSFEEVRPALPDVARGLRVALEEGVVRVSIAVSQVELARAMQLEPPAPKPVEAPKPVVAERKVIRIVGLDDGPREIPVREIPVKPPQ